MGLPCLGGGVLKADFLADVARIWIFFRNAVEKVMEKKMNISFNVQSVAVYRAQPFSFCLNEYMQMHCNMAY